MAPNRSLKVYKRGTTAGVGFHAACLETGCRKTRENKMPGNIRSTSSNLLLTCYLVVRFTPTMNVGWLAERPARGERRKEGRKGHRRKENWWGWTTRLRPYTPLTGVTSFRVCVPVRPRSWNSPEKEIRGSFTCSRASPTHLRLVVSLSSRENTRTTRCQIETLREHSLGFDPLARLTAW